MVDFDKLKCTDDQREAICHFSGPALVLAGPGSGKTFVITTRVRYLIENCHIKPSKILVITFTKSAAVEMKSRVAVSMGGWADEVAFGTFHSIFFNILKEEGNYNSDAVLREYDKFRIIRELLENVEVDCTDVNDLIKGIVSDISKYKSGMYVIDDSMHFSPASVSEEIFAELYQKYQERLFLLKKLDFDDMLLNTFILLKERRNIRYKWASRFDFIMIDEFQDIDRLQFEIVKLLLSVDNNLFVVGDDDQSIYSFRGASPQIMLDFGKEFPASVRINLVRNFRCAENIVRAALTVIEKNKDRYSKLITAHKAEAGYVKCMEFADKNDECEFLLELIKRYKDKSLAILCRTNTGCGFYSEFLKNHNIVYNMREKVEDIYSQFPVSDILAYIRLAVGKASLNDLYAIINRPLRYVSREAVFNGKNIEGIIRYYQMRGKYSDIIKNLNKLKRDLDFMAKGSPFAAILYILKAVGYEAYLRKYARDKKLNFETFMERLYDLMDRARGYKSIGIWLKAIEDLREAIVLEKGSNGAEMNKENRSNIYISTLHASKGLEYDVVMIMDIADGNIPYHRAKLSDSVEEERRLFYVGMTRAKEALFLAEVKQIRLKSMKRSAFMEDIAPKNNKNA